MDTTSTNTSSAAAFAQLRPICTRIAYTLDLCRNRDDVTSDERHRGNDDLVSLLSQLSNTIQSLSISDIAACAEYALLPLIAALPLDPQKLKNSNVPERTIEAALNALTILIRSSEILFVSNSDFFMQVVLRCLVVLTDVKCTRLCVDTSEDVKLAACQCLDALFSHNDTNTQAAGSISRAESFDGKFNSTGVAKQPNTPFTYTTILHFIQNPNTEVQLAKFPCAVALSGEQSRGVLGQVVSLMLEVAKTEHLRLLRLTSISVLQNSLLMVGANQTIIAQMLPGICSCCFNICLMSDYKVGTAVPAAALITWQLVLCLALTDQADATAPNTDHLPSIDRLLEVVKQSNDMTDIELSTNETEATDPKQEWSIETCTRLDSMLRSLYEGSGGRPAKVVSAGIRLEMARLAFVCLMNCSQAFTLADRKRYVDTNQQQQQQHHARPVTFHVSGTLAMLLSWLIGHTLDTDTRVAEYATEWTAQVVTSLKQQGLWEADARTWLCSALALKLRGLPDLGSREASQLVTAELLAASALVNALGRGWADGMSRVMDVEHAGQLGEGLVSEGNVKSVADADGVSVSGGCEGDCDSGDVSVVELALDVVFQLVAMGEIGKRANDTAAVGAVGWGLVDQAGASSSVSAVSVHKGSSGGAQTEQGRKKFTDSEAQHGRMMMAREYPKHSFLFLHEDETVKATQTLIQAIGSREESFEACVDVIRSRCGNYEERDRLGCMIFVLNQLLRGAVHSGSFQIGFLSDSTTTNNNNNDNNTNIRGSSDASRIETNRHNHDESARTVLDVLLVVLALGDNSYSERRSSIAKTNPTAAVEHTPPSAAAVALALEGVGQVATALGANFRSVLVRTLFAVLQQMGHASSSNVHQAASSSLLRMARACGYTGGVAEMIRVNFDYVVDGVIARVPWIGQFPQLAAAVEAASSCLVVEPSGDAARHSRNAKGYGADCKNGDIDIDGGVGGDTHDIVQNDNVHVNGGCGASSVFSLDVSESQSQTQSEAQAQVPAPAQFQTQAYTGASMLPQWGDLVDAVLEQLPNGGAFVKDYLRMLIAAARSIDSENDILLKTNTRFLSETDKKSQQDKEKSQCELKEKEVDISDENLMDLMSELERLGEQQAQFDKIAATLDEPISIGAVQKEEEPEDGGIDDSQEREDEEMKKAPLVVLSKRMLECCANFASHSSPIVRQLSTALATACCSAQQGRVCKLLLPTVHKAWPAFVAQHRLEKIEQVRLNLLSWTLCLLQHSDGFVDRKFSSDVLPVLLPDLREAVNTRESASVLVLSGAKRRVALAAIRVLVAAACGQWGARHLHTHAREIMACTHELLTCDDDMLREQAVALWGLMATRAGDALWPTLAQWAVRKNGKQMDYVMPSASMFVPTPVPISANVPFPCSGLRAFSATSQKDNYAAADDNVSPNLHGSMFAGSGVKQWKPMCVVVGSGSGGIVLGRENMDPYGCIAAMWQALVDSSVPGAQWQSTQRPLGVV